MRLTHLVRQGHAEHESRKLCLQRRRMAAAEHVTIRNASENRQMRPILLSTPTLCTSLFSLYLLHPPLSPRSAHAPILGIFTILHGCIHSLMRTITPGRHTHRRVKTARMACDKGAPIRIATKRTADQRESKKRDA